MEQNTPFFKELTEIVSLLKIYRAYDKNGPISLRRIGKDYDGGYIIPEKALQEADVVMGYGIGDDPSFEEMASAVYGKRSYGFDGSVALDKLCHPLFYFAPIYIVSEAQIKHLEGIPTKYSSFKQHLKIFHLQEKKIFIKMDIEAGEYLAIPDILQYTPQITGITFEIHFAEAHQIPHALDLIKKLQNDYVLLHLHGHNASAERNFQVPNARGEVPRLLELSYINKNLITRVELSENQKHPTPLDMPSDPKFPECDFEFLVSGFNQ